MSEPWITGPQTAVPFPDPPLTDGVVLLRPWMQADLPHVVRICQHPSLSRFSPGIPSPYTDADARDWFEGQEPERLAGRGLGHAVTAADGGQLLGAIGVHGINPRLRSAETGYWLALEARGHGYMTRALKLVCAWSFDTLGIERIELTNDPENHASQKVAARAGFTREGHLRSHMRIRSTGERRDSLVWGLLPGELSED